MGNFVEKLSTKWVDYVEDPMKYQALRPHFFSMGGWLEGSGGGGGWVGAGEVVCGGGWLVGGWCWHGGWWVGYGG